MKTYQIKELQKELAKMERIANSIKEMINDYEGPVWGKNNLIKEFNKHVRIAKAIREDLKGAF
ncbi:hypothetical protein [Bacillus subtilis]|uniref:hypothetical protein n=1 Tax=Bacillus subtilis TaxID=1423 RepID=UPI00217DBD53|nr:hypothetical protein [Bacillus subtilis]MEC0399932.1 hypothetical protein [Bacillus subtilis]MEC0429293.1 hypothetical protein [Bacillus subtilis]UWJ02614.1 hypothetical protein N0B18_06945 [Bacillus subtilis]WRK89108.1 hypothetical protein U7118_07695 [Bacillus subtilis]